MDVKCHDWPLTLIHYWVLLCGKDLHTAAPSAITTKETHHCHDGSGSSLYFGFIFCTVGGTSDVGIFPEMLLELELWRWRYIFSEILISGLFQEIFLSISTLYSLQPKLAPQIPFCASDDWYTASSWGNLFIIWSLNKSWHTNIHSLFQ